MNRRKTNLEAIRGIVCLIVVFCHFPVQGSIQPYIVAVARSAVPFFLLISGYFSYREAEKEGVPYVKKKLFAAIKLTAVATVVCALTNSLLDLWKGNHPLQWVRKAANTKNLLRFLLLNRANWLSSVMYYLFMLIYVYVIFLIVHKLRLVRIAYLAIPILLVANVIVSKTVDDWFYAGNFLLTGIPFFALGLFLRDKKIRIGDATAAVMIAAGVVCTLAERYFIGGSYVYVGTILLSVGLFMIGLSDGEYFPKALAWFGTQYSMLLFILHCCVGVLLRYMFEKHKIDIGSFLPFVVIAATLVVSTIVLPVKRRCNFGNTSENAGAAGKAVDSKKGSAPETADSEKKTE